MLTFVLLILWSEPWHRGSIRPAWAWARAVAWAARVDAPPPGGVSSGR